MCVYTDSGVNKPQIELLPALPTAFTKSSISGVKGRNPTTINKFSWNTNASEVCCSITSHIDQTLTLMCRRGMKSITGIQATELPLLLQLPKEASARYDYHRDALVKLGHLRHRKF